MTLTWIYILSRCYAIIPAYELEAAEQTMYRLTEMNTFKTQHIISQDIESSFNNLETSDLTFIISERPIYTHRAILRIRCEYFKSMLTTNNWKESRSSEITITQFTYSVYEAFLKYIYTGRVEISPHDAISLLALALRKNPQKNMRKSGWRLHLDWKHRKHINIYNSIPYKHSTKLLH